MNLRIPEGFSVLLIHVCVSSDNSDRKVSWKPDLYCKTVDVRQRDLPHIMFHTLPLISCHLKYVLDYLGNHLDSKLSYRAINIYTYTVSYQHSHKRFFCSIRPALTVKKILKGVSTRLTFTCFQVLT